MGLEKRGAAVGAAAVFATSLAVYARTLTPTVPFWDSGEFIAVSHILGIPHPPGTPFYVILGRLASLVLPWPTVAQRVNGLSALASALAVALTFLVTLKLIRLCQRAPRSTADEVLAWAGAAAGSLMLAFSDTFWENATEAEVYALMSLAQILVLWLGLRWWEAHEKKPTLGPLFLIAYVMWLCVGLHLGVGLMGLPLLVLVAAVDREVAVLFALPYLVVMLMAMGMERVGAGALALFTALLAVFAARRQLPWSFALGAGAVMLIAAYLLMSPTAGFHPLFGALTVGTVLGLLAFLALRTREGKVLALAVGLVVIGFSTHLYLPIRAAQRPAINEGDPSTWGSLRRLLDREQYGQTSMFQRRGRLDTQLNKEFWRYVSWQWPVLPGGGALPYALPLALGVAGAAWQARREKRGFAVMLAFAALSSAGLILFLNFSDKEVRDRDYFFTSFYHAFSLWIGMGVAVAVGWVRDSFGSPRARVAAGTVTGTLLLAMPFQMLGQLWFKHDRSRNYVARDYAYNMLEPLAPNAFVFTNGDNDTFPLWYLQEVERVRKDVRVVNLSLLQTDWYIRQLRDDPPRLPVTLDDRSIEIVGRGAFYDSTGQFVLTAGYMVDHLLTQNRWRLPAYFAVTVPEHHGWDAHFTLEGLVYRVQPDTVHPRVDYAAIRRNLYQLFRYRGLFTADGSWDSTVYKDENASTLTRNYAAAHLQLAVGYRQQGRLDKAIAEMERVERMFPDYAEALAPLGGFYLEAGDTSRALALFERLQRRRPEDPEVPYALGELLALRGDTAAALDRMKRSLALDPNYPNPYLGMYQLLWALGRREEALERLRGLARLYPDDPSLRAMIEQRERELGIAPSFAPPPPPGGPFGP